MHRMKGGKPPGKTPDKASFEAFHDVRKLSAEDPLAGAVINGRYELIGRVGSGGMAKVYLAMDRETHARVAVKIVSDNPERMDEITERFFIEAKAAGMINHPNIIGIKDIGTYRDKIFCVMEYLEGFDLSALLANRQGMRWGRARGILAQVCDALEAAHQKGVIHRDMKPENVMLIPQGKGDDELVKVLDFGLAKLTDSNERLTRDNIVLGTPSYMAPEQAWSSEYDHRVDIYALGVMAYEMVCGRVPFFSDIPDEKARTLQVLLMHRETPPESLRARKPDLDIPPEAEAAIMRALEKEPSKRFASAREMKEALLGSAMQGGPEGKRNEAARDAGSVAPAGEEGISAGPEAEDSGRWMLPREEETLGRTMKRVARRTLVIGAIAAAIGIPAYHFRSELFDIYEATRHNSSREDAQPPRTERQQAAPVQTSYHARIESTPRGASVMDVTGGEAQGRPLGRTPLDVTFQNWENVLMVSKRGYYPSRIVVTRSQPEQRVTLKAIPRQGSTTGGNETEGTDDSANKGDGGSGATPEKAGRQGEQQ